MKKAFLVATAALAIAGTAMAQGGMKGKHAVKDWKDLDAVHNKIVSAMKDMDRARKANHYDMDGHGAKAEDLLKQAEAELKQAVESAKQNGNKAQ